MSTFDDAVKYLDQLPASTTPANFPDASGNIAKYGGTVKKARPLNKLNYTITIPANSSTGFVNTKRGILYQYNYTMPSNFIVTKRLGSIFNWGVGAVIVKWQVGSTIYRYGLNPFVGITFTEAQLIAYQTGWLFPVYNNQIISKKFSLEFLMLNTVQNVPASSLETSILYNPSSSHGNIVSYSPSNILSQTELSAALPELLPTQYPNNMAWSN